MQNGDTTLLSITLASWGFLVKMFITHESHGILGSYFAYLYIFVIARDNIHTRAIYYIEELYKLRASILIFFMLCQTVYTMYKSIWIKYV